MKNIIITLTLVCCAYALAIYAQGTPSATAPVDTVQSGGGADSAASVPPDTVQSDSDSLGYFDDDDGKPDTGIGKPDSSGVGKKDSFDDFDSDDDLEVAAGLSDTSASAQRLGGIKREHERKRQVTLAIVMMVLIILALGTSQSFNPK